MLGHCLIYYKTEMSHDFFNVHHHNLILLYQNSDHERLTEYFCSAVLILNKIALCGKIKSDWVCWDVGGNFQFSQRSPCFPLLKGLDSRSTFHKISKPIRRLGLYLNARKSTENQVGLNPPSGLCSLPAKNKSRGGHKCMLCISALTCVNLIRKIPCI